jgi:hypothetical protein
MKMKYENIGMATVDAQKNCCGLGSSSKWLNGDISIKIKSWSCSVALRKISEYAHGVTIMAVSRMANIAAS